MSVTHIVLTLVIGIILKVLPACIPTKDGKRLLGRFAKHIKLSEENTVITVNGKNLEGEEKRQVIKGFNEANFLKEYYIFPGNEKLFLQPKDAGTPCLIHTKSGKKEIRLFVYIYNDHVDVVKQVEKKVIAYKVNSAPLQKMSLV